MKWHSNVNVSGRLDCCSSLETTKQQQPPLASPEISGDGISIHIKPVLRISDLRKPTADATADRIVPHVLDLRQQGNPISMQAKEEEEYAVSATTIATTGSTATAANSVNHTTASGPEGNEAQQVLVQTLDLLQAHKELDAQVLQAGVVPSIKQLPPQMIKQVSRRSLDGSQRSFLVQVDPTVACVDCDFQQQQQEQDDWIVPAETTIVSPATTYPLAGVALPKTPSPITPMWDLRHASASDPPSCELTSSSHRQDQHGKPAPNVANASLAVEDEQDRKPAAMERFGHSVPSNIISKKERSPSKSPRMSLSFAAVPVSSAGIPNLEADDDDEEKVDDGDKKPAAKPTAVPRPSAIPTANLSVSSPTPRGRGRGGLGLRGGRRQQGDTGREARRQQIRGRAGTVSNMDSSDKSQDSSAQRSISPILRAGGGIRRPVEPGTITRDLPGDGLSSPVAAATAPAPGDSLATMPAAERPAPRSRARPVLPIPQLGKVQNPGAEAYAAIPATTTAEAAASQSSLEHSLKQRMRRQHDPEMPSSERPGAYKEIPGRGLIRNNTLRFSIMTTMQRQKKSLRRMFSSSKKHTFASASTEQFMNDGSNQSDGNRNPSQMGSAHRRSHRGGFGGSSRRSLSDSPRAGELGGVAGDEQPQSYRRGIRLRSVGSIPSVLVEEGEEDDKRSYLGNISFRSLIDAREHGGLCVARPVFQREPSTLEALCIIPGNLAVASALEEQIKQDHVARLEALASCRHQGGLSANSRDDKRATRKRRTMGYYFPTAKSFAKLLNPKNIPAQMQQLPRKVQKFPQQYSPKNLHIFRRGKKPSHTQSQAKRKTGTAKLHTIPSVRVGVRRNSF